MKWTREWNSSRQPRKQRAFRRNAPLHAAGAFLNAHVAKPLKEKAGRNIRVRTGDTVKVVRGSFKGKTGKVERVDVLKQHVFVTGIERVKRDGSKSLVPLRPNAFTITELDTSDKRRMK